MRTLVGLLACSGLILLLSVISACETAGDAAARARYQQQLSGRVQLLEERSATSTVQERAERRGDLLTMLLAQSISQGGRPQTADGASGPAPAFLSEEIPVRATFFNRGEDLLQVHAVSVDELTGELFDDLVANAEPRKQTTVISYPGDVWRIKKNGAESSETVAEYVVDVLPHQPIDLMSLLARWQAVPEDRRGPLTFDEARVDPEGAWVAQGRMISEDFVLVNAMDAGLICGLSSGEQWEFVLDPDTPNAYVFRKAYSVDGLPTYTATEPAANVRLVLQPGSPPGVGDTARLEVGGQTLGLARHGVGSVEHTLATALIDDPDHDRWARATPGRDGWRRTSEDRAVTSIIEGFSGELLASQLPSYRGYNVTRLDPLRLGSNPGLKSGNAIIFAWIGDRTRDWNTQGSGYRVPWFFQFLAAPQVQSDASTQAFFSDSERNTSSSTCIEILGKGGSYSRSSQHLDSQKLMSIRASKWASEYWLMLNKPYAKLSDQFVNAVWQLPTGGPGVKAAYIDFFETFGTHYPVATLYGGRAYYERTYTASQVRDAMTQSWGVKSESQVSVPIRGATVSVNNVMSFDTTNSVASGSGSVSDIEGFSSSGGDGTTMDGWALVSNKNLQPIKVSLRPVDELLLPRLFAVGSDEAVAKLEAIRGAMSTQLVAYLGESADRAAVPSPPRAFAIRIKSVVLTEESDGDGALDGAEPYGTILLRVAKDNAYVEEDRSSTYRYKDGNNNGRDDDPIREFKRLSTPNAEAYFRAGEHANDADWFPKDDDEEGALAGVSFAPRVYWIEAGAVKVNADLDKYRFEVEVDLWDQDTNEDERIMFSSSVSLKEVAESAEHYIERTATSGSVGGFGKIEITYFVEEITIGVPRSSEDLPRWPFSPSDWDFSF